MNNESTNIPKYYSVNLMTFEKTGRTGHDHYRGTVVEYMNYITAIHGLVSVLNDTDWDDKVIPPVEENFSDRNFKSYFIDSSSISLGSDLYVFGKFIFTQV